MKFFPVLIALFISGEMVSQEKLLGQLRKDLGTVLESEALIIQYLNLLEKYDSPVSKAYFGLLKSTQAAFVLWPATKLSYFNEGRSAIESAVAKDPGSIEIRFVRVLVQCNAPAFLGYSSQINEDVDHIINGLKQNYNSDIAPIIIKNLVQLKCLDKKTISNLKNLN